MGNNLAPMDGFDQILLPKRVVQDEHPNHSSVLRGREEER